MAERITDEELQKSCWRSSPLHRFRDPKKAAEMFTEDGAFEMPYLESFGLPGRYEGREAMIDTPEQAFAEYEFTAESSKTGRTIHDRPMTFSLSCLDCYR